MFQSIHTPFPPRIEDLRARSGRISRFHFRHTSLNWQVDWRWRPRLEVLRWLRGWLNCWLSFTPWWGEAARWILLRLNAGLPNDVDDYGRFLSRIGWLVGRLVGFGLAKWDSNERNRDLWKWAKASRIEERLFAIWQSIKRRRNWCIWSVLWQFQIFHLLAVRKVVS